MVVGMPNDTCPSNRIARHVCPECGRAYKAAETLNRHRNNHSETTRYCCNVDSCGAVFKRKDLLDRHLLIHTNAEPVSHRRRGHRACIRCSRLKTRCDNFDPCSRCSTGGHLCLYKTDRGRVRKDSVILATPPGSTTGSSTDEIQDLDGYADPLLETASSLVTTADWSLNAIDMSQPWPETPYAEWNEWASYPRADSVGMELAGQYSANDHTPGIGFQTDTGAPASGLSRLSLNPSGAWVQPAPFMPNAVVQSLDGFSDHTRGHAGLLQSPYELEESCMGLEQILSHQQHAGTETLAPSPDDVVSELMMLATDFRLSSDGLAERNRVWREVSRKVQLAFAISEVPSNNFHLLGYLVKLFLDKFDNHWPIIRKHSFQETQPAHLYIVMAAIGAAYAGRQSGELHVQMMDALRRHLLPAAFRQPLDELATFALCQSLALLQAAMLYFGNRAAFQNAQEVGSAIVTLAQRVRLFDERCDRTVDYYLERSPPSAERNQGEWIQAETRRRLAVGILRLECFLSSLLGTRPKITYEDVNVRIPAPAVVWLSEDFRIHAAYQAAHDWDSHLRLSRMVQTSLETEARLSSLRPDELEHVLYGLQHRVWRLSQDRALSEMPLDFGGEDVRQAAGNGELNRLVGALQQWKQAMTATVRHTDDPTDRRTILNSQLLYSVTIMTLEADLPAFHRWALGATRDERMPEDSVIAAKRWAASRSGQITAQHALSIRTMVAEEQRRPESIRAIFTIITQIALLHAALVMWVYVGVATGDAVPGMDDEGEEKAFCSQSALGGNAELMRGFADLLRAATPLDLEVSTRLRSYHTTPAMLAERPSFGSQGSVGTWAYSS